jgi:hypothetical protein
MVVNLAIIVRRTNAMSEITFHLQDLIRQPSHSAFHSICAGVREPQLTKRTLARLPNSRLPVPSPSPRDKRLLGASRDLPYSGCSIFEKASSIGLRSGE